jgi:hypothetical protein
MKKYDDSDLEERIILERYNFLGKVIVYVTLLLCVGIIVAQMLCE